MKKPHKTLFFFFIAFCLLMAAMVWPIIAQEGKIVWSEITSPALAGNLIGDPATKPYATYLPPGYETSDKRYPVLYVLHGYTQNAGSLTNIKPTIDLMIRNHDIGEIITVFVDGSNRFRGSEYQSSETIGDYETYIVKDLVNHVDANYRTITHRNSRGITGYSMGGYGAMRLAIKYPDVFSVVVAQGGYYDNDTDIVKSWALPTASANPKDWVEFDRMPGAAKGGFEIAAALSPNPDKPPFFLDKPYELVDGKAQLIPEVWKRWVDADVVHGHLDGYLKQPIRLRGIMIVHGSGDAVVSVSQGREFDKVLTDLGVDHVYDEHSGGHIFIAQKSLQFMAEHLVFDELPVDNNVPDSSTAVTAGGKLATTWGRLRTR